MADRASFLRREAADASVPRNVATHYSAPAAEVEFETLTMSARSTAATQMYTQTARDVPIPLSAVSGRRPRVLILQGMCKQYRVPLFTEMYRHLAAAGIDLRVAYSAPLEGHRARQDDAVLPEEFGLQIPAKAWLGDKLFLQLPLREILDADLVIVEHALKHLVNYPLLLLSVLRLKKLGFWVHGGTLRYPSAALGRALRKTTLRAADWIFAYTSTVATDLAALGAPSRRTTALQNAIDLSGFRAALEKVTTKEICFAHATLGLPAGARVALFCGSLYPGRGIDFLVEAGDLIARRDPLFHLVVLGSGPLEAELAALARGRSWLHPLGGVFGDARALYFRIAQVALMPYRTGLGILDAMAAGLPYIVTGADCFNPEIDYLVDGVTGLVTGDDVQAYADHVYKLLNQPAKLLRLSAASRAASASYSIENMASNFVSGIGACLEIPTAARAHR